MLSNDIEALAPGQGCSAALLDAHAKVVSLLLVHCLPDRLVLETDRVSVRPTLDALERLLFSERVELEDLSGRGGMLGVAGPRVRAAVEKVLEQAIPRIDPGHHAHVSVDGLDVRVVRTWETGEEGYDLWIDDAGLPELWERAIALGAQPVGREAWNILRVEAGIVWHGVDVDASTLIVEAPLGETYSLTKGCYVGQEVVARVTYRGHVNRKIVGLLLPDARTPPCGAAIRVAGKAVGRITSAVVSPVLGRGLALGVLRREWVTPGTHVELVSEGGRLTAEVAALPFYRRVPEENAHV
jgi:aminomethyltransferase